MIKGLRSVLAEVAVGQAEMSDGELIGYVLGLLKAMGEECGCGEVIDIVIDHIVARYMEETRGMLKAQEERENEG